MNPPTRPGPRPGTCRPFSVLDGMILVGGAAVGLAAFRGRGRQDLSVTASPRVLHDALGVFLMIASSCLLICRVRRPRPTLPRVARQPGASANFFVVAFGLIYVVDALIRFALTGVFIGPRLADWLWFLLEAPESSFALMIPVFWAWLALAGWWRPEPGWIDRSGWLVGGSWTIWAIAGPFL